MQLHYFRIPISDTPLPQINIEINIEFAQPKTFFTLD